MTERAKRLHSSNWMGVFYMTGGGSGLLSELLQQPGASRTVLEATVPYSDKALADLIRRTPEQACCDSTARSLAMAAFERAKALNQTSNFGLGCTASLATDRKKKDVHRAHWAIQTASASYSFSADYANDRKEEEQLLVEDLWVTLESSLLKIEQKLTDRISSKHATADDTWMRLLHKPPHKQVTSPHDGMLLLPGSFNPIHQGHIAMLKSAEDFSGLHGAFEISIRNADKPSLDYLTLNERLEGITSHPVWITNTPTFEEKAQLFPKTVFALGADTVKRIAELRFYNHNPLLMEKAFEQLTAQNIKFLVFGRVIGDKYEALGDLNLPSELVSICKEIPEELFRMDLSSTALRKKVTEQ